jgi:hypothetical protein
MISGEAALVSFRFARKLRSRTSIHCDAEERKGGVFVKGKALARDLTTIIAEIPPRGWNIAAIEMAKGAHAAKPPCTPCSYTAVLRTVRSIVILGQGDREPHGASHNQPANKKRVNPGIGIRAVLYASSGAGRGRSENSYNLVGRNFLRASIFINDIGGTRADANAIAGRQLAARDDWLKAVAAIDSHGALDVCKHRGLCVRRQQCGDNRGRHVGAHCLPSMDFSH